MPTITIRIRTSSGACKVLTVDGQNTIDGLRSLIASTFQIEAKSFDLLWGFPPKVCELPGDYLVEGNIPNGENIRVQPSESRGKLSEAKAAVTAKSPRKTANSKTRETVSKSIAAASFSPSFGGRVVTLTGPTSSNTSPASRKRPNNFSSFSSSNRKQQRVARPRKRKAGGAIAGTSGDTADGEGDICEALLSAVSGGMSMRDRALRSVFRRAVELQYDSTTADARLAAAFSGQYTLRPLESVRLLGSGECTRMEVSFPRSAAGSARRSTGVYSETVDLISSEAIKAVLKIAVEDPSGHGREILKPANMARQSPRIFWSLIRFYGADIPHALAQMFPEILDWSWLSDRKRGLSEKALHNLEQQRLAAAAAASRKDKRATKKLSSASKTADSTEGPCLSDTVMTNESANNSTSSASSCGVSEEFSASLESCTKNTAEDSNSNIDGEMTRDSPWPAVEDIWTLLAEELCDGLVPDSWLAALTHTLSSNCTSKSGEDDVPKQLSAMTLASADFDNVSLRQSISDKRRELLEDGEEDKDEDEDGDGYSQSELSMQLFENWVGSAQGRIVDRILELLCGQCGRLYRCLVHRGLAAPAALRIWRRAPEALYQSIIEDDPCLADLRLHRPKDIIMRFAGDSNEGSTAANLHQPATLIAFSVEWVQWMADISHQLCASTHTLWLQHFFPDTQDDEEDNDEEKEDEHDDNEGWQCGADCPFVGRHVRLLNVLVDGYWEEGVVMAYLPPDEEDPEALWRVRSMHWYGHVFDDEDGVIPKNSVNIIDVDRGACNKNVDGSSCSSDAVVAIDENEKDGKASSTLLPSNKQTKLTKLTGQKRPQPLADRWIEDIDEQQLQAALIDGDSMTPGTAGAK